MSVTKTQSGKIAPYLVPAALLALALLALPGLANPRSLLPNASLDAYQALTMLALLPGALIIVALLLSFAIRQPRSLPLSSVSLLLGLLLLAKALHSLYWLLVWDRTGDSWGIFLLVIPIVAALFAGLLLAVLLKDWKDSPGLWFSLTLIALLIGVFALAQQADPRQITDARAGHVAHAIERYYAQNDAYPPSLAPLSRWYAPLPVPVRIFGQDWCYQSGPDYFRLGFLDREHWSDPRLIGRIARTAGQPPGDLPPLCMLEVAALQSKQPDYPYTYWRESR